jgi:hypothetical protein
VNSKTIWNETFDSMIQTQKNIQDGLKESVDKVDDRIVEKQEEQFNEKITEQPKYKLGSESVTIFITLAVSKREANQNFLPKIHPYSARRVGLHFNEKLAFKRSSRKNGRVMINSESLL